MTSSRLQRRLFLAAVTAALSLVVSASASAAITLPPRMGALGDSLATAYGAGGAGIDSLNYSFATGSDLLAEGLGYSHLSRLQAMNAGITGAESNFAKTGSKIGKIVATTDSSGNPIVNPIGMLPRDVGYVTVMVGSADLCQGAKATGFGSFKKSADKLVQQLKSRLGVADIVILSIPNWTGIYNTFKNDSDVTDLWAATGACPRLFGAGATAEERAAVDQTTRGYNAILASACSLATTARFKCYFAGAVFRMAWTKADLSSYDGFHPSAAGQARLSKAGWTASPYRLRAWGLKLVQKPVLNRRQKKIRLNIATAPRATVLVRALNKRGRLLGSATYTASASGRVIRAMRVPGWRGQRVIRLVFKTRSSDQVMVVKRKLRA